MAEQSLQLKLTQKLALAPQLQQAIRLLQLNRIELREYIQEVLDTNPLLERSDAESLPGAETEPPGATERDEPGEWETSAEADWGEDFGLDDTWSGGAASDDFDGAATLADEGSGSLREHLLWQINLSHFSARDAAIATAIVFALDDDGFLADSLDDIRASVAPEILAEPEEILAVLHRVQRMEPVGVASRGPGECLRVQLSALPADTPGRDLALRVVRDFLDLVAEHDTAALRRATGAREEALATALQLIQSLDPRPGARFDNRRDEYLVPDVYVTRHQDAWRVTLNPDNDPGLRLNRYYIDLLRKSGGKDVEYLRGRLQEARWLLSSLEMRNRTLLRVAQAIVDFQPGFLAEGEIAMRPLILRDVAEQVGVHESTVSRATTRKYLLTPRGIYELKYFFSSHVDTTAGEPVSATAVKARLQVLLEREPPDRPLSDQELAALLEQAGIRVARRTVAKYREALGIGSSSQRRRAHRRHRAAGPPGRTDGLAPDRRQV